VTSPRRAASLHLARSLTDRDRALISHLVDHRVLTTHHIVDLLYTTRRGPSIRWAQRRLATLRSYGILDRFRPRTATGSAPYHWILDTLGAEIATYQQGLPKTEAAALVHAGRAIAHSPTLAHTTGVLGFFTALARTAATRPGCRLEAWWSQRRCATTWTSLGVQPDGYGTWTEPAGKVTFLLEWDTGTQPAHRVAAKLTRYPPLVPAEADLVLIRVHSHAREDALHAAVCALDRPRAAAATAVLRPGQDSAARLWRVADTRTSENRRRRLGELA
jgi:hypothetical protein